MVDWLRENKILVIILVVSFIVGGWLYYFNHHHIVSLSDNIVYSNDNQPVDDNCLIYTQAGNFVGERKCVYGKIVRIYVSKKGNIFLDFCQDYKTCPFSAVIFQPDASKFPDLTKYQGKNIEITGLIKTYQGRPEIIINEPKQIKIK